MSKGDVSCLRFTVSGWVGRPQEQAIWPFAPIGSPDQDHVLGALFLHHGPAKEGGARVEGVTQMRLDRFPPTSGRGPMVEPSSGAVTCTPEKWLSPLPPPHGSPVIGKGKSVFGCNGLNKMAERLFWFQIGMMVEMARQPPNLDRLMKEGIAFVIDTFKHRIPQCPLGKRPVMIGRRKASYDTIDKVMKRLDLIMNVMSAMQFIVIDIH